mgnify:CR=1 FL=1
MLSRRDVLTQLALAGAALRFAPAELLAYTATLLPRHLPLIVTIGDNEYSNLFIWVPATGTLTRLRY